MADGSTIPLWLASTTVFASLCCALLVALGGRDPRSWRTAEPEPLAVRVARWAGARLGRLVPGRYAAALAERYAAAGTPWGEPPEEAVLRGRVLVCSALLLVMDGGLGVVTGSRMLVSLAPLAALAGALVPLYELRSAARRRERLTREAMPWMLDLTVLALRAGGALEEALAAYAATCGDLVLPREIGRVVASLRHGTTRQQAFTRLAERCPFEHIEALCRTVHSLDKLGVPVADALAGMGEGLRREAVQRAESEAARAGERMLLPLILTAAAFFVVIMAPFIGKLSSVGG